MCLSGELAVKEILGHGMRNDCDGFCVRHFFYLAYYVTNAALLLKQKRAESDGSFIPKCNLIYIIKGRRGMGIIPFVTFSSVILSLCLYCLYVLL